MYRFLIAIVLFAMFLSACTPATIAATPDYGKLVADEVTRQLAQQPVPTPVPQVQSVPTEDPRIKELSDQNKEMQRRINDLQKQLEGMDELYQLWWFQANDLFFELRSAGYTLFGTYDTTCGENSLDIKSTDGVCVEAFYGTPLDEYKYFLVQAQVFEVSSGMIMDFRWEVLLVEVPDETLGTEYQNLWTSSSESALDDFNAALRWTLSPAKDYTGLQPVAINYWGISEEQFLKGSANGIKSVPMGWPYNIK